MATFSAVKGFARSPFYPAGWVPAGRKRTAVLFVTVVALVISAIPAAFSTHNSQPNDPLYASTSGDLGQWGPRQIRANQASHHGTGSGAVIAIVDSGVDFSHPDLAGKLLAGRTFRECGQSQSNGCGTGSWTDESRSVCGVFENEPCESGHGTHVAGIAAAATDNGLGIAGVAPDAKILPVKALDEAGGSFEDVSSGIRWAVDRGAHVINLSLGIALAGVLPGSQVFNLVGGWDSLNSAIAYARSSGAVVVAASGNELSPLCSDPAFASGALCVTSTDSGELRPAYSNHPINDGLLAVAAPGGGESDYMLFCGGGILSTVPVGTGRADIADVCGYPNESGAVDRLGYDEFIGTSMATPHVAGVAALLAAQGCFGNQIENLITGTARQPLTGERGAFTPIYGYGIVDADQAASRAAAACASGVPATVALSPSASSGTIGSFHAVTAKVRDGGGAVVEAAKVPFSVTGANRSSGEGVTDAQGNVTFSYPGAAQGSDTITAFADTDGDGQRQPNEPQASATRTWSVSPGVPAVSIDDAEVTEGSSLPARFTLTLSHRSDQPVLIRYALKDGTASFVNAQGPDYLRYTGQVMIPANTASVTFGVKIFDDDIKEGPEFFQAQLLSPVNASSGQKTTGTATILDDDTP